MPLDSITIGAIAKELDHTLAGGRLDKIYMPRPGQVVMQLRGNQGACRLLLAADGASGRVHLTGLRMENPDTPPMFCMLLRKHLAGGRVLSVRQPDHERMLVITLSAVDEMGVIGEKQLVCELMGRRTNLILVGESGVILACLKRVDSEMSPDRPVLPGLKYRMPPRQDKLVLAAASREELEALVRSIPDLGDAEGYLMDRAQGLSPLLLRELIFRAGGDRQALADQLFELQRQAGQGGQGGMTPTLLVKGGAYFDYAPMEVRQYGPVVECRAMSGFSQLLDEFYRQRTLDEAKKSAVGSMIKTMTNVRNRLARKLEYQKKELAEAENRDRLKRNADLITANLHAIRSGDRAAQVVDYFTEGMPEVRIELDPDLSPQQNAQRLFHKYQRLKNAELALRQQIDQGAMELEYVENVLYTIGRAEGERELSAIRDELMENGYLKRQGKKKKAKPAAFAPRRFATTAGEVVLCGRNNRENDELTLRRAQGRDLWFHVKGAPGSHVILCRQGNEEPSARSIEEAAAIAAFYSSLSAQPKVAVDYTYVKSVKKPQGAKAGMVNYFDYHTALVAPRDGAGQA